MTKQFEDYREIISSFEDNEKLIKTLKKSISGLLSELNKFSISKNEALISKKNKYLDELYYFEKVILHIEANFYKSRKNLRESASHNIHHFLTYLGLDTKGIDDKKISGIVIDSRLVKEGNVFFALQGENESGENYIDDALAKGAAFVFASNSYTGSDNRVIKVDNSLNALKTIAKEYKKTLNCKVLAITGSVGKTTCKNFAHGILSEKYRVGKTFANYNTVTGVSMSILDMPEDTEFMVLELGVDTIGEMDELVELAEPDYAIISNIFESHLERFGTKKAIFDEKIKIVSKFAKDSVLVISGESEFLSDYNSDQFKIIKVFEDEKNYKNSIEDNISSALIKNVKISSIGTSFSLDTGGKTNDFAIKLFGKHLAFNAAIAIMACSEMGISFDLAKAGILECRAEPMRFDVAEVDGYRVINDAYNSSFSSLVAAIETAKSLCDGKLYVLIGDILEIGDVPKQKHFEIGKKISDMNIDYLLFYGENMKSAYDAYNGKNAKYFDNLNDITLYVLNGIDKGDTFLAKASRGLALERVCDLVLMNIIRTRFVDILLDVSEYLSE